MGQVRQDNVQIKLEIDGSQSRTELDNLTRKADVLKEGMKGLKKGSEEYVAANRELSEVNGRMKELQKEIGLTSLSSSQLTGMSKQLNRELAQLTPNTESFLNKAQELAQVDARLAQVRKEAKGVKDDLEDSGGGFSDFVKKSAAFVGIGLGIETVVDTVKELASEVINAAKEMDALRSNVNSLTGATGTELDQLTTGVAGLAKTFNKEYDEVLIASNALSKQMGISQQESLRLIEQGFLAGADSSGEFLDQLKEYPAQFKAAGLSADEAIAVISQSVTGGVFSDKGADVVKEFGLRIREQTKATKEALEGAFGKESTAKLFAGLNDGSITTTQALQQVSKGLNETSLTAAQAQTVIADVFGGPGEDAGIDYLKSLQNVGVGIDALVDKNNEFVQRQMAQLAAQKELAAAENELAKEYESTGTALDTLRTRAMTAFVSSFVFLIQLIRSLPGFLYENRGALLGLAAAVITLNAEQIKLTATTLYNTAVTKGKLIWDEAATFATTKWTAAQRLLNLALAANPIGVVVAAAALLIGVLVTLYQRSEKVREVVAGLGAAFMQVAKNIKEAVLSQLGGVADILTGIFTLDADKIKSGLAKYGTGIKQVFTGLGTGAAGAYHEGFNEREKLETAAHAQKKKEEGEKQVEAAKQLGKKVAAAAAESQLEGLKAREANIKAALASVAAGSAEELALKKKEVEIKRDIDLLDEKKTAADRLVIRAEAARDLRKLDDEFAAKAKDAAEKQAKERADVEKKIADLRAAQIPDETERKIAQLNAAAEREKAAVKGTAAQIDEQKRLIEEKRVADEIELRRVGAVKAGLVEVEAEKLNNALIVDVFDRKDAELLTAHKEALLKIEATDVNAAAKTAVADKDLRDGQKANDQERVAYHQSVQDSIEAIDEDTAQRSRANMRKRRQLTLAEQAKLDAEEQAEKLAKLAKQEESELAALKRQFESGALSKEEYEAKKAAIEANYLSKRDEVSAFFAALEDARNKEGAERALAYAQLGIQALSDINKISSDKELAKLDKDKKARLLKLDQEYKSGLINKDQYEKQKSSIEANYDAKTRAVKKEAAEKEKQFSIAQSIISGILAVIKAGGPFNPVGAITAIAAIAATAKIIATPIPEFEQGGTFGGTRRTLASRAGQAWRGVKQFATGAKINPVAGVPTSGQLHSGGGIRMVDGATGEHLGEWERGEPYMILSRDTYANNREIVDALLDTSLHRGGAPVRRGAGGYYEEGGTPGGALPGAGSKAPAGNDELVQAVRETRDAVRALPSRQHIAWDQEDTANVEEALAERQDTRDKAGIRQASRPLKPLFYVNRERFASY